MIRATRSFFKRFLSERKIVIISQNRVRSIPIGPKVQLFFWLLLVSGLGWTSYSTGLFLAYQKVMVAKDEQFQKASRKNEELSAQFTMMHRDMQRLMENGATPANKDEYEDFLMDLYAVTPQGDQSEMLTKRISYLESRITELEHYQQSFLETLGSRTGLQIDKIKRVIDMTGLNVNSLSESAPKPAVPAEFQNQGGPFIGINGPQSRYFEKDTMDSIIELVQLSYIFDALPLGVPVENARVSSDFGARRDPLTRRRAVHYGLDFAAPHGTAAKTTAPGTVISAGRLGAYGNMVEVDHGFGISTRYAHLQEIKVEVGDILSRGDVVGIQGNTGRSTGHHLHYEVRYKDRPLDPHNFLNAGEYAEKKGNE